MAEVQQDPCHLPCGFDEDFVNPVNEDFCCIICKLPQKEPVITICGHKFCRECLEECFRRQEQEGKLCTCPYDGGLLDKDRGVFPEKDLERKILSLTIKCANEGCDWTDELRAKEGHLASCMFTSISCTNENCGSKVPKKDLKEHVTMQCPWRAVQCDHCHELHPECQIKDHHEKCRRFPVICPKCMAITSREMIENHVENYCQKTLISCPYVQMGCKTQVQREKLESHYQSEMGRHIKLACLELAKRTEELNKLKEEVNKLRNDFEKKANILQNQIDDLKGQHEEKANILEQQDERVKILQNEVDVLKGQFEEKANILEQQGEGVKTLQDEVDVLRGQHEEKANILEQQEERVKTLQDEVDALKGKSEEKANILKQQEGRVMTLQAQEERRRIREEEEEARMNDFREELQIATNRKWVAALALAGFALLAQFFIKR